MQHAWHNFSIVVRKLLKISSHPHEITYYFGNCSKGKKLQKVHMQTRVPAPTFPHSWWKTDAGNSWHNLLFCNFYPFFAFVSYFRHSNEWGKFFTHWFCLSNDWNVNVGYDDVTFLNNGSMSIRLNVPRLIKLVKDTVSFLRQTVMRNCVPSCGWELTWN